MDANGKTSTPSSRSFREPSPASSDEARDQWAPAEREPPKPGSTLAGKYRIDGVLGRGGMSVVMAGHQLGLDRPVAIKFLRGALAGRPGSSRRFSREAMAVAKMRSEHVVRVIDEGDADGLPFIVMELLDGSDLAAVLAKGPLPIDDTITILREAAEAIAEAHALGIVHRDLKPSNLFLATVRGQRVVKVLDFGVSKWLGIPNDGDTPFATGSGAIMGTPAYASPEQLKSPEGVDARSDVWALGVVLYQCLSGRRPFEAESFAELCAAILESKPPRFEPKLAIAPALWEIVERCLQRDPKKRFQSVRELERALADFQAGKPSVGTKAPLLSRRKWAIAATLGAALLLLVVLASSTGGAPVAPPNPSASSLPNVAIENVVASAAEPRAPGLEQTVVVRDEPRPAPANAPKPAPTVSKLRAPVRNAATPSAAPAAPPVAPVAAPPVTPPVASAPSPPPKKGAPPPIDPNQLYRR